MERKMRHYRQGDELFDLIGRLADQLKTNRTTILEMGVHLLADRLIKAPAGLREMAEEIDTERRTSGPRRRWELEAARAAE